MHKEQKKISFKEYILHIFRFYVNSSDLMTHYILIYPMYKVSGMINPNLKTKQFLFSFLGSQ